MSEVLIIGAGPTGLTLAYELVKRGIDVRIVDQASQPSIYSKALAIQPKTLEILEKMDLIDQFLNDGLPLTQIHFHKEQKNSFFHLLFPKDTPFPYILIHPQSQTEKILNKALESQNKQVERGVTLKNIVAYDHAILQHPDGNEEIVYPKWIVACDGAHSTVRNVLNLPFKGGAFTEAFVIADAEVSSNLNHDEVSVFLSSRGFCSLIPLPSFNQYRIIVPFKKEVHLEKDMVDAEFIQRTINDRIIGQNVKLKSCSWISLFYIHRHIIPHFRYKNIFLAGDAAHVHSPAGGQGLNTSIQDAQNLAWKLALVIKGHGKKILLNSYEKERLPVAEKVLKETTKATKKINFFQKNFSGFFFWLITCYSKNKKINRKFSYILSELDINYEESPITHLSFMDYFWNGPHPGYRAPDVTYFDSRRLFSHFKDDRFILLFFENESSSYFADKIKTRYNHVIKVITVANNHAGIDVIHDQENKILKRYNAQPGSFYLIRPDGYIAFRQKKLHEPRFLKYLEKILK